MPRIQISLSKENLDLLELIQEKSGMSKSAQINSLITKFLKAEYKEIVDKRIIQRKWFKNWQIR